LEPLEPRQLLAGDVAIDTSQSLGIISPKLIGTNVIYSRESDALWADSTIAESLKDLRTGFMRYPGGEVTSFYHWNHNTGVPFKDSWDAPVPVQPSNQWMSFDEYMRQVQAAGATPLVGINIQSGHNTGRVADGVAEAVALVRYAKNRGYGVEHYFIDNEQYADNANMSATQYANYVNLYAAAMRKVDPSLKIVVNWQGIMNNGWKTILKIAGPNIDYIDFHAYWNRDAATFGNWRGQRLMTHAGETYFAKIQSFRQELAREGLDSKIAAFEWNLGPAQWDQRPSPFQAALMNSEVFMQFVWAKLDAAAFWPLHYDANAREGEDDRSLLTADDMEHSAIYQMLSMYKELLGKELISVQFRGSGVLATAGYRTSTDTATVMLLEKTGRGSDLQLALGDFLKQPGTFQVQAKTFRAAGGDLQADRGEIVDIPFTLDRNTGEIRLAVGGYTLTKVTIRHLGTMPTQQLPPVATPTTGESPPVVFPPTMTNDSVNPIPQSSGNHEPSPAPPQVNEPKSESVTVDSPSTVSQSPPSEVPKSEIAPRSTDIGPKTHDAQSVQSSVSPPAESQLTREESESPPAAAVDNVFASLEPESDAFAGGEQALSLRVLLSLMPEEIISERKRRGRDAFLAHGLLEAEAATI
jgi:hypothetical protein